MTTYEYLYKTDDILVLNQWTKGNEKPFNLCMVLGQLPVLHGHTTSPGYRVEGRIEKEDGTFEKIPKALVYFVPEEWVSLWNAPSQANCICSIDTLMLAGCKCGWIQKERKEQP